MEEPVIEPVLSPVVPVVEEGNPEAFENEAWPEREIREGRIVDGNEPENLAEGEGAGVQSAEAEP